MDDKDRRRARFSKPAPAQTSEPGFVSRGDTTLTRPDAQEKYFAQLCRQLAPKYQPLLTELGIAAKKTYQLPKDRAPAAQSVDATLLGLCKLREAMVTSKNPLKSSVYALSIELAAREGHHQSYVPAIAHTKNNLQYIEYLILHLVHFVGDLAQATVLYFRYLAPNQRVLAIIRACAVDDWVTWTELYNSETHPAKARIMSFGVDSMVAQMVRVMTAAYFQYPVADLVLPKGVGLDKTGWTNENGTLVIRKRK
ncbi:hypothetical protein DICA0_A02520 [Diutina catenulata]